MLSKYLKVAAIWTEIFSSFSEFLIYLKSGSGSGYVWIYALILLAVLIFTVILLRKQVGQAEDNKKISSKKDSGRGEINKENREAKKRSWNFSAPTYCKTCRSR